MGLVTTLLNGIGLSNAVPTFQAAGIVTPAALAELDVAHFEALGISDPDDRRKLFYLVQRIKMAVSKDKKETDHSVEKQVDAVISGTAEIHEEKKEDTTKPKKTKKVKSEKKKAQSSTMKTPTRRSKRLASPEKSDDAESEEQVTSESYPPSIRDIPASPAKESLTQSIIPTKADSSPHKPKGTSRQPTSSKARVEKRQEEDDNNDRDDDKIASPVKTISRKTSLRTSKSSAREEQNGIAEATPAPPAKNSTTSHSSGLKKPTPVAATVETKLKKISKLPNPGKSIRTGKALSAIPSDVVAPMSPLSNQLVADLEDHDVSTLGQGRLMRQNSTGSQGSRGSSALDSIDEGSDDQASTFSGSNPSTSSRRSQLTGAAAKSSSQRFSMGPSESSASSNTSNRRRSVDPASKASNKTVPFVQGGTQTESWATQVQHLRDDNDADHELFRSEERTLYEFDMRIRVIVRKRPVSNAEASLSGGIDVIHPLDYGDYGRVLVYQPKTRVDLTKEIETIPFAYDNVYDEKSTNREIYQRSLRNLIQPFFRGQQSTVFAYGQTGSG